MDLRRLRWAAPCGLALVLSACASGPRTKPVEPTPAPSGTRGIKVVGDQQSATDTTSPSCAQKLCVGLRVLAADGGQLAPGASLRSGDKFAFWVRVSKPAFVYVVHVDATKEPSVVFPKHGELRVSGGAERRIPPRGQTFQLDDSTGTENVYVVASTRPLATVDRVVAQQLGAVQASASDHGMKSADHGVKTAATARPARARRVKKRSKKRRLAAILEERTRSSSRGFKAVRLEGNGAATANESGVAFYHFHFQHKGR